MRQGIRVVGTAVIFFFSVYTLGWAFSPVPQSRDEMELLVIQAREMIQQGHFHEAVTVLQRLLPRATGAKDQARIRLLLSRAYLSAGDAETCDESLRAIFEKRLHLHVDPAAMEADLRLAYDKIKAEYWYGLGSMESVEEKMEKRVIVRPAKKPKKKRLWPKLVVGAILLGAMVTLVLLFTGKKEVDPGEAIEGVSGLMFENTIIHPVSIEIGGVTSYVAGRTSVFVRLNPGYYLLSIFYFSFVYTDWIQIRESEHTHFVFSPPSD